MKPIKRLYHRTKITKGFYNIILESDNDNVLDYQDIKYWEKYIKIRDFEINKLSKRYFI